MNCLTYANILRKLRMRINDAVIRLTRQGSIFDLSELR